MENLEIDIRDVSAVNRSIPPRIKIDAELDFSPTDVNETPFDLRVRPTIGCGSSDGFSLEQTFCEFDSDQNLRGELEVTIPISLSSSAIEKIEAMRDEQDPEEQLGFTFEVTVLWEYKDSLSRASGTTSDDITSRDWEAVLDKVDWQGKRAVEMSIPESHIGDLLNNAYGQITKAEEHHNAHRYDDALLSVRSAIQKLQHIENDDSFTSRVDTERRERVSNTMDEFDNVIRNLSRVTDLGGHAEEQVTDLEGPIRRRDSELAIDVTKSYLRFLNRVLDEN